MNEFLELENIFIPFLRACLPELGFVVQNKIKQPQANIWIEISIMWG